MLACGAMVVRERDWVGRGGGAGVNAGAERVERAPEQSSDMVGLRGWAVTVGLDAGRGQSFTMWLYSVWTPAGTLPGSAD